MPDAIEPLLAEERTPCPPERATTAVFYSISNCQKGLRGVSFGNFLIKQVVEESEARTAEAHDLRHAVAGAGLRQLARPRAALGSDRAVDAEDLELLRDARRCIVAGQRECAEH